MSRFVTIILDGFGIGAMKDVKHTRPQDINANTFKSIAEKFPDLKLKNLADLGLMNAVGFETDYMKFNLNANFGCIELMHFGADSFLGHQEIMGTKVKRPQDQNINESIDEIEAILISKDHQVKRIGQPPLQYLLVDEHICVSDNIDSDLGQAINCIGPLDFVSFEKLSEVGLLVRSVVKCNRVIVFGGTKNTVEDILEAEEIIDGKYIGNVAVKTKSYLHDYRVIHLGYGVDFKKQAPTKLAQIQVPVFLVGKVADIVFNPYQASYSIVDTNDVMDVTIDLIKKHKKGFICTNVQETDLAGHSMDSLWYKNILEIVDEKLAIILNLLESNDILIVCADHGNDPEIGHNHHTRELVPLLMYQKELRGRKLGVRKTLGDIGATVCDFFGADKPENGVSFL